MRKAVAGVSILIVLSLGALLATSSGVLYHEEKSPTGASTCHYFTGLGVFTTPSYSVDGCPRFIKVGR